MNTREYWAYSDQLESEACYARARFWLESGREPEALLWQVRAARFSAKARARLK